MFLTHLSKQNLWLLVIALFLYNSQVIASSTNPEENECHQISIPSPNSLDEDDLAAFENSIDAQKYVVSAKLGNAKSQYLLAVCYFFDQRQLKQNTIEAAFWARRSVLSGYQDAQDLLKTLYSPELVFYKTLNDSFDSYLELAKQNDVNAQIVVADCYLLGCSMERSDVEAAKWYQRAASQGNPHAQVALGQLYYEKKIIVEGNEGSDIMAYNLFLKAAKQNNLQGLLRVSDCLNDGRGVEQNKKHAVNYFLFYILYQSIT